MQRLLPKGAAALVPCDRAQFLSHFQKFHISCTKVRMRACVRCVRVRVRVRVCVCARVRVCVCLRVHSCVLAGGHSRVSGKPAD